MKSNNIMKKLSTILGLTAVLFITACGGGGDLVGTWKPDTAGMNDIQKEMAGSLFSYTFDSGGKGSVNMLGMPIPMEWKIEGDELVMTMEMMGQKNTERSKFTLSGNSLTIIEEKDGATKEMKLVRE